jgi:hypothetical protein
VKRPPNVSPQMFDAIMRMMAKAPESVPEADMPKPVRGRRENPLPLPGMPSARAPKVDRLLTGKEKEMYRRFKGNYPPEGMTLAEFRRYMGQVRKRGGFR